MSGSDPRIAHGQLIGVFKACKALGLRRSDRLEVATILLDRNVETFRGLSDHDVDRLWHAFNGAVCCANILWERHVGKRV